MLMRNWLLNVVISLDLARLASAAPESFNVGSDAISNACADVNKAWIKAELEHVACKYTLRLCYNETCLQFIYSSADLPDGSLQLPEIGTAKVIPSFGFDREDQSICSVSEHIAFPKASSAWISLAAGRCARRHR